ncbi:MAG: hypothetical protein JWO38_121 [Gemmataceae bacterium]|nr:hypothetical protein [Gemmataceae bacterium]
MSRFLTSLVALATLAAVGCSTPAPPEPAAAARESAVPPEPRADAPRPSPDQALAAGVVFLLKQQSPDGAWRSDVYATFKDGPALTPLVVCALQAAADAGTKDPDTTAARRAGSTYLAKMVKPDGTIDAGASGLDYPVYTAALAVKALSHPENMDLLKARDAWLKYLLDRQLTEKLGWKADDKQYGGWGYCRLIPKKPVPNAVAPPLVESNLSATVFALDALKAAAHADPGPYILADTFLRRCQNEDGGFFFIYDDPVRNKAGSPDLSPAVPTRFHSYGSTTADGVRGTLITEPVRMKAEDETAKPGIVARGNKPPLIKGLDWLEQHFRPDTHPGKYIAAHERNREAVYYYYAASVSAAFRAAGVRDVGEKPWAGPLAAELARRQAADGSWANPVELVRENDPVVATGNAVIALANCKAVLGAK